MRILLLYEHISREGEEIKRIAHYLRKKGVEVRIFSIIFEYAKAIRCAKRSRFDIVVMPWAYTDKQYTLTGPFIDINPKTIVISLDHEEIGSEYSLPALLPRGENAKKSVIHFVWGQYFANLLSEAGVDKKNIVIAGNGRTDFIFNSTNTREETSKKYGLDKAKKWVLFAENRGFVYTKQKRTIEEHARRGIPAEQTIDFYNHTVKSIEASRKDFNKAGDAFFEKYELIYRPHPGTVAMDGIDDRIKIISDGSIYDWLSVVDINITWSSTSIYEGDAMGVLSIIYEPIDNKKEYRSFGTEGYYKIRSLRELLDEETINKAAETQKREKRYQEFYGIIDGRRCENIAEELIKCNNIEGYKANPSVNERMTRLKVFEYTTVVFSKLGLIKILKWPTTSYDRYNDIPWLKDKDLR